MPETIQSSKITIDDLAVMIGKQFQETQREFRSEIHSLRTEMNDRFDRMEVRFDLLETKVMRDHEPRLKRVERELKIA
jgi:hypothetical protein